MNDVQHQWEPSERLKRLARRNSAHLPTSVGVPLWSTVRQALDAVRCDPRKRISTRAVNSVLRYYYHSSLSAPDDSFVLFIERLRLPLGSPYGIGSIRMLGKAG